MSGCPIKNWHTCLVTKVTQRLFVRLQFELFYEHFNLFFTQTHSRIYFLFIYLATLPTLMCY